VSTSAPQATWLSPPQVAELLGIDDGKVVSWIRRGELVGVNVADRASGKRARWRVSQASLDEFLMRRQCAAPIKPIRRKRRRHDCIEFF
jgi:excisionase family DNA binding protein